MGIFEITTLTVLTLNIWGLPGDGFWGPAPHRGERVKKICEVLKNSVQSNSGWDAVFLQEVWLKEDRKTLRHCGYTEFSDPNNSNLLIDSGLLILSKFPLSRAKRLTYPAIPLDADVINEGEALAKKAAHLVKMSHPKIGDVWLGNTHLVSYYGEGEKDKYAGMRKEQFKAFVEWVFQSVGNHPVVLGGDWNFGPEQNLLWELKIRLLPDFVVSPEAFLFTTLSKDNVFQEEDQDRVDHLYASPHFQSHRGDLAMNKPFSFKGKTLNLSDHFGWTEIFEWPTR